ncbi:hypothetical protein [Kribbella sp. NBC_00889]|uniref:phage holin n=1 Tax=Kribbella sp. NBC_00889 TaxID=2975974 RepID=UPI00386CE02F|nr:hypothetical protein OG817_22185 [Kribbella sp. NBC_00889]
MSRLVAALRRNPVRAYLYGLALPGEALAVSYGLVNDNQGALWLGLAAALLLVPGVETVRAKVTPTSDPRDDAGRPLVPLRTGGPIPPPPGL